MRSAAVAVTALLAVSCTTARPAEPPEPLPSPASSFVIPSPFLSPHPFTARDLASIVLGRRDTLDGTEFARPFSVDRTIDEFASDDEELRQLSQDRFVAAHITVFVPTGQLAHDAPPAELGSPFVQGIAAVFETPVGADSSLRRYVANLRASQLQHEVTISADGLGDSSEGLRGQAGGEDVTIYAWRTANLLLVVSGSGTITPELVRTLADRMQRRADLAR